MFLSNNCPWSFQSNHIESKHTGSKKILFHDAKPACDAALCDTSCQGQMGTHPWIVIPMWLHLRLSCRILMVDFDLGLDWVSW